MEVTTTKETIQTTTSVASAIEYTQKEIILTNTCETNSFCQNDGLCMDTLYGYKCQCMPNFTGPNCDLNFI